MNQTEKELLSKKRTIMITKEFDDLYLLHPIYPSLFEQHIYGVAEALSQHDENPYDGGYWKSKPIGSGWFFELQYERSWHIINENNFADEVLSSKAFSLAVFLISLSGFLFFLHEKSEKAENVSELMKELTDLHSNIRASIEDMITDMAEEGMFWRVVD